LTENAAALQSRLQSPRVRNPKVRQDVAAITPELGERKSTYAQRAAQQAARLQLPAYPTTTIGSFPQTPEIRKTRRDFRAGELEEAQYRAAIKKEVAFAISEQERLGLD